MLPKFFTVVLFALFSSGVQAGPLRDMIKDRWQKKQSKEPAPVAEADLAAKITRADDYTFKLKWQDVDRYYKVHVPKSYNPKVSTPVIFFLHGGAGNMEIQSDEKLYHIISKSEDSGFVAVFPNGFSPYRSGKFATWNAGACCGAARDGAVDDVGFIKEVAKNLFNQMNIDRNRVYAAGMSNGGMMAYRLACEAPDIFKAIAAIAGTDNTRDCQPKKSISVLHIHAKNDDHVLFEGGAGESSFGDKSEITEFVSVPATIRKWAKLNSCKGSAKRVLTQKGAYCDRYDCSATSQVQICVTEEGKHSWPGGGKPRLGVLGGKPSNAVSANDLMWDFFKGL